MGGENALCSWFAAYEQVHVKFRIMWRTGADIGATTVPCILGKCLNVSASILISGTARHDAPAFHMNASGRRAEARLCNPAPGVRCLLLCETSPAVAGVRGDAYGYACSRRTAYYA